MTPAPIITDQLLAELDAITDPGQGPKRLTRNTLDEREAIDAAATQLRLARAYLVAHAGESAQLRAEVRRLRVMVEEHAPHRLEEGPPAPTAGSATHWTEAWATWRAQQLGQDPLGRTWIDPRKDDEWDPNPEGIQPGQESGPRMDRETGLWEVPDDEPARPERGLAKELQQFALEWYENARHFTGMDLDDYDRAAVARDQETAADFARQARQAMGLEAP